MVTGNSRRYVFEHSYGKGKIKFKTLSEMTFLDYEKKYYKVQEHLCDGDCYQLNLTSQTRVSYDFSTLSLYNNFLSSNSLSEFAHTIFIKELNQLIHTLRPTESYKFNHLRERIGHTPLELFFGSLLGLVITVAYILIF